MSKNDKIKEQIGWLKVTYGIGLATDISLIAWLFNNYSNVEFEKLVIALFVTFLVTFIVLKTNVLASRKIDELEEN